MLITTVVSYDNTGIPQSSFPPIHSIQRTLSVYQRVDASNNEVLTVTHTDAGGATRVTVTSQVYDRSAQLLDLYPQKNSIDLLI